MGDSTCVLHVYPHESTQGSIMHNMSESVSLGRFMSEQLSWEKWSTFSSNRYVEEAERYAQPGSVAQKKAFFEAHYKRIAAQKAAAAAALIEQADNNNVVSESTNHAAEAVTAPPPPPPVTSVFIHPNAHDHSAPPLPPPPPPPPEEDKVEPPEDVVVKEEESSGVNEKLENLGIIAPPGSDEPLIEKPLLMQQNCSSDEDVISMKMKKKSAFSSLKSSVYRKTSNKVPGPSPARMPQIKKPASPMIKSKKKQALDFTDKKKTAPKSPLHSFVNSSPVKQLTQLLSPKRKTDVVSSSRIAPDSSKMSQNCKTPMMPRHSAAVATPCPADTRTNTPAADGNKTGGPKRHILTTLCSKSLTACRNKLQSPTLSTPFLLRTEERAARRKQKLEEKFESKKDVEKLKVKVKVQPPQTSFKEKAELELRRFQQSFCFKARPLPDFYKEREAQSNQIKKNPVSPKLGRKPNSRAANNAISMAKSNATTAKQNKKKNGILKHVSASSSLQEMINHENSSPNIQH